jgi:type II secretory pathway pseudopilin PulG
MNPAGRGGRREGFTLVETLAALGICAGLAATVAATASTVARCEALAEEMSAAARRTMRLYAAARAGEDLDAAGEVEGGTWRTERERAGTAGFRDNRWQVPRWRWTAVPPGRGGEGVAVEVAGMPEAR